MNRYAVIGGNFPREFLLLQGTGCRWRQCTFCDYHEDASANPFETNRHVLEQVSGKFGVLDIINSGSAMELDPATIGAIRDIVRDKGIHTLWFEAHYMYRHRLEDFAAQFHPARVKFRCGVETFDASLRERWRKGIAREVSAQDVARYFQGVCLLCCTDSQEDTMERLMQDINLAEQYFEYYSVNLFCANGTDVKRNHNMAERFMAEVMPQLQASSKAEVLVNNNDLGVG